MKNTFYLYSTLFFIILSCSGDKEQVPYVPTATCTDGIQNGTETSIDCGGVCGTCKNVDIPTQGYDAPSQYDGYSLLWSDEFSANVLDTQKWGYHTGTGCPNLCDWGNAELQYFTDSKENVYVENGNLIIKAINRGIDGKNYTSGRIHTDNKFEFKFGRVDIRASMPKVAGTWAAFFMMNKNYNVNNPTAYWPKGGEIDIVEYLGENHNDIMGTAHYGIDFPVNHKYNSAHHGPLNNQPFSDAYYVYSIIWEQDKITWLINNVAYHSITPTTTAASGQPYPFNDEFYFNFALSVGGNLPKVNPTASNFPTWLIIDYVRVFQKN